MVTTKTKKKRESPCKPRTALGPWPRAARLTKRTKTILSGLDLVLKQVIII